MSTPPVPGVDRDALAEAIQRGTVLSDWKARRTADVALAHIAAHHECALPATWDDGGARPVTWSDIGWLTSDGVQFSRAERHDPGPAVVTDRDRTPDPIAPIKPFRHPWITGDDSCGECGQFFRDHWWADAGDHGHTVCYLPEHADEWVEVDEDTWDDLPDGTRLRREWRKGCWRTSEGHFVHRDDLPDDPRALIARELGPAKADTFLGLLDEHGWTVTRKGER